jgi:hypothetical protein
MKQSETTAWTILPQNAALSANGWYHAWGTESDIATLDLKQPGNPDQNGDMQAGRNEHTISCVRREPTGEITGCGSMYAIIQGNLEPR